MVLVHMHMSCKGTNTMFHCLLYQFFPLSSQGEFRHLALDIYFYLLPDLARVPPTQS